MLALILACSFRPAGTRATSLVDGFQISGDHRQDEERKHMVDSQVDVSA